MAKHELESRVRETELSWNIHTNPFEAWRGKSTGMETRREAIGERREGVCEKMSNRENMTWASKRDRARGKCSKPWALQLCYTSINNWNYRLPALQQFQSLSSLRSSKSLLIMKLYWNRNVHAELPHKAWCAHVAHPTAPKTKQEEEQTRHQKLANIAFPVSMQARK